MADKAAFLKLIRALESGNNPDVIHRTMTTGMHEGDSAVGEAGLMPNTAKEMASRKVVSGNANQADKLLLDSDNPTAESMLQSNPDLRKSYTDDLATQVMNKTGGNPDLGATAWLYGHNNSPDQLKALLQQHPDYQNRINDVINNQHLMSEQPTVAVPTLQQQFEESLKPRVFPYSKIRNSLK